MNSQKKLFKKLTNKCKVHRNPNIDHLICLEIKIDLNVLNCKQVP